MSLLARSPAIHQYKMGSCVIWPEISSTTKKRINFWPLLFIKRDVSWAFRILVTILRKSNQVTNKRSTADKISYHLIFNGRKIVIPMADGLKIFRFSQGKHAVGILS